MDAVFERFHEMLDQMVFSGFLEPRQRDGSPRDEMLRNPEDEIHELPTPEPWIPFSFFGDLVKPDMMDKDFFRESQRRRHRKPNDKKDVILDDDATSDNLLYSAPQSGSVHRWSQSFSRKTVIGPDGQIEESETRIEHKPDGTKVQTTVERSPQGERKRIILRKRSGEEEVQEMNNDYQTPDTIQSLPTNPSTSSHQKSVEPASHGLLESLRRWYRGQS